MDTHGSYENNKYKFTNSNSTLIKDFYTLICSLGIKAKINTNKNNISVMFKTDLNVFKLKRKPFNGRKLTF